MPMLHNGTYNIIVPRALNGSSQDSIMLPHSIPGPFSFVHKSVLLCKYRNCAPMRRTFATHIITSINADLSLKAMIRTIYLVVTSLEG